MTLMTSTDRTVPVSVQTRSGQRGQRSFLFQQAQPAKTGLIGGSRARLFGQLAAPARVTMVSAPPGSGKTVLLRSWVGQPGVAGSAAWVPAGRGERDPQRFWLSVLGALRQTSAGSALVRAVTAAPDLDGLGAGGAAAEGSGTVG